ncbi:hypothetical protein PCASD_24372 [Puccinia coronata f. sp. avenae]|uniref:Uncharacterized protein n=2 Tax=Puccinia coronata f. sp. avenae TaxID=200324 RepID=A0A2N5S3K7_9BASI|nr:hypothetical protein PCASD_24372 [Puccinia coronata f. sp. avenae]
MEKNGSIRPNARTLIPAFVLIYMGMSISTIHFFRRDLKDQFLSTLTITLSLCTYPFILCTGWTKIWNVLRAVPSNKDGLAMRHANRNSTLTYFKPRTMNLLAIFFYAFPFAFAGPLIYLVALDTVEINEKYRKSSKGFLTIISGKLSTNKILKLNDETLTYMSLMQQRGDKILFYCRLISFGYFLNIVALLFMMLFGYFYIIQAVRHQIRIFRQAAEHHIPSSFTVQASGGNDSGLKSMSISTGLDSSNFGGRSTYRQRKRSPQPVLNISRWLPAFRPDPDFLQKSQSSTMSSNTEYLNDSQQWECNNREIIYSQWNALQRYQVNLIWQASCNTIVMVILAVMDFIIFSNYLEIPARRTLCDLNWFTVTVANVTWVLTIGIPFGLVNVVVAFSSPITALRERTDVVNDFDY